MYSRIRVCQANIERMHLVWNSIRARDAMDAQVPTLDTEAVDWDAVITELLNDYGTRLELRKLSQRGEVST